MEIRPKNLKLFTTEGCDIENILEFQDRLIKELDVNTSALAERIQKLENEVKTLQLIQL